MRIFDVHHHVGSRLDVSYDPSLEEKIQNHVERLDEYGITSGAVMPSPTFPNTNGIEDTRSMNDDMATVKDDYGDRFPVAFGTVDPWYGEEGLYEIDRTLETLELDGMMWHNRYQRMAADAEMMKRLVARVVDHGGVVVLHAYAGAELTSPWRVLNVAESFPQGQFVVVDIFSSLTQTEMVAKLSSNFGLYNVWFDISLPFNLPRQIRPFKEAIGVDKLLFGMDSYSDSDEPDTTLPMEQFDAAELTDAERRAILYENAAELFNLT